MTPPITPQQPTDKYGSDIKPKAAHLDPGQFERQKAELEERERRIAERERALTDPMKPTSKLLLILKFA